MAGMVEKLVRVVARAFYTDEAIIIMEGLIREKFIKDDEMGNAVNLQTKQVRKIIQELHRDHVVCVETLNDKRLGGKSSMDYWYIDYKYFVDVVKYRLYKVSEVLKEREQLEMVRQIYKCSNENCGREYTALEAQRLIVPGQHEFLCGHCNEPLLECNTNESLNHIQSLQKKFKEQMNKAGDDHDGIFEILRKIGTYVAEGHDLPSNLPSENRAAGLGGESIQARNGTSGQNGGTGARGARQHVEGQDPNADSYLYPYGLTCGNQEVIIHIDTGADEDDLLLFGRQRKRQKHITSSGSSNASDDKAAKLSRSLPEFLRGSAISGHLVSKHQKRAELSTEEREKLEAEQNSIAKMYQQQEKREYEEIKSAYAAEMARYEARTKVAVETSHSLHPQDEHYESHGEEDFESVTWEDCSSRKVS